MSADIARAVFAWQMQADRRLWDGAIMRLPESAFTVDSGYSWGSLQRECVHVVDVMQASLQRLQGIQSVTAAVKSEDPTRAEIRAVWDQVEARWHSYMAQLDDETFKREIDIVYRETAMTTPVWQTICHCFNHNTLHRAEMRQMVAFLGGAAQPDPGFLAYCRDRARRGS